MHTCMLHTLHVYMTIYGVHVLIYNNYTCASYYVIVVKLFTADCVTCVPLITGDPWSRGDSCVAGAVCSSGA